MNLDNEVRQKAEDEGLSAEQAEEIQEIIDETDLDVDDAYEVWQSD